MDEPNKPNLALWICIVVVLLMLAAYLFTPMPHGGFRIQWIMYDLLGP